MDEDHECAHLIVCAGVMSRQNCLLDWCNVHPHTPKHPHTLTPTHPHTHTPTHPHTRIPSLCFLLRTHVNAGGATAGSIGRFSQSQYASTGGDMSQMGRTRDSGSMDDVVDHVRSLNQALSDLLTTDPTAPSAGARSSHAV